MSDRFRMHRQAEIHDPELPCFGCMLADLLAKAEAQGRLRGRVTVVPFANPLGLGQVLHGDDTGRFDLYDGRNLTAITTT